MGDRMVMVRDDVLDNLLGGFDLGGIVPGDPDAAARGDVPELFANK